MYKNRPIYSISILEQYTINSYADLEDFYDYFRRFKFNSIPLFEYGVIPNLPLSSTSPTVQDINNRISHSSRIDYIDIYSYGLELNQTRWLSLIAAYPDGRFIITDNRNQHLLLLNENGTFRIDLTGIFRHQIGLYNYNHISRQTIHNSYSFARLHIDYDGYVYLLSILANYIYIFSPNNRLVRCLTPRFLGISIIRSDCFAVTHTGLIYLCDDTYRTIRIYTRMGIPQKNIYLDYLPLKLFISNTRIFTYSVENLAKIQIYTLAGLPVRTLSICSYNLPSEVNWFRGKYFLTCGSHLYVLNDKGEQIAQHNLITLLDYSNTLATIHDFAVNKKGLLVLTFRRNGTLFNRYWIVRPAIF